MARPFVREWFCALQKDRLGPFGSGSGHGLRPQAVLSAGILTTRARESRAKPLRADRPCPWTEQILSPRAPERAWGTRSTFMQTGSPSRTAFGAALHRAAHQLGTKPLVFDDPLALAIVGPEAEQALREGSEPRLARPAMQAFLAARGRFAEDCLAEAVARGVTRYVLLGAGLDTFAFRAATRFPTLSIFEIDHPATQAWKRARVAEAGLTPSPHLTYVPIDFERQTLREGLAASGFAFDVPAMFAWLGVVPYLSEAAIDATLGVVAAMPAGEIVFDYATPASQGSAAFAAMSARVAEIGEPFKSFFQPDALAQKLKAMGFSRTEDWDAAALNTRYFENRGDGLKLLAGHLMRARV